jgi:MOSC domain-containing protein
LSESRVTGLFLYPVKACGAVGVVSAAVGPFGLIGDREWQVVPAEGGVPLTQRRHPVLATVRPEPVDGGLVLRAPGRADLVVDRPSGEGREGLAHLGERVAVLDAGIAAARWFSDLLGVDARLETMADEYSRRLPAAFDVFGQEVALGDAAPVHVTNETSLEDLAARAAEPFGMERFRPNVVVRAEPAWTEDTWVSFAIGGAELRTGAPWPRCTVPQVDQATGERHREPALVLRAHRWCEDAAAAGAPLADVLPGNALFGIACGAGPVDAVVSVGDAVDVRATADPVVTPPV